MTLRASDRSYGHRDAQTKHNRTSSSPLTCSLEGGKPKMNTNTNTHRIFTATVVKSDESTVEVKVAASIIDAANEGIGTKSFLREHLRRMDGEPSRTRATNKAIAVTMGSGKDVTGVPTGFTEVRVTKRAITTNNRAKKVRLGEIATRIEGFKTNPIMRTEP